MSFTDRIPSYLERIETALERHLPPALTHPARFHSALRYSVLGGGKRLRPLLVYATGEWLELAPSRLDAIAVAIEFVHAYSLVHDDLPAMDDDELRRGRATVHVAFDEATAILAGDALQAHAYLALAADPGLAASAEERCALVRDLARASGGSGMAGGQAMDMAATGEARSAAAIEDCYARKTGRLLQAAVTMPCRIRGGLSGPAVEAAGRFGAALGLAFQVADDIIDIESPAELMGKPQGSDLRNQKATLPAIMGLPATRERLRVLRADADEALALLGGQTEGLATLCDWITRRDR